MKNIEELHSMMARHMTELLAEVGNGREVVYNVEIRDSGKVIYKAVIDPHDGEEVSVGDKVAASLCEHIERMSTV